MVKRICIFCDGTWNVLSAPQPTNVVLAAQMVLPYGDDEVQQLVYYRQGVGTSFLVNREWETRLAGAFGLGLFENVAEAYRFLVFNYRTGDEIFIFGFSRGAFTARSLAGLIRKCGIVTPDRVAMVDKTLELYRERGMDTHPDRDRAQRFRADNSPEMIMKDLDRAWRQANGISELYADVPNFTIKFLGVWDTVGALGIPKHLLLERLLRTSEENGFHDTQLSTVIEAARHAVALDEDRRSFEPTLWDNLDDLNAVPGRSGNYRELWFPGDHGSVGGGGDIRGLSHAALLWVLEGAAAMGLGLDEAAMENVRRDIDPLAALHNSTAPPGWFERIYQRGSRTGPVDRARLSDSTLARLGHSGAGWVPYRPAAIDALLRQLFP